MNSVQDTSAPQSTTQVVVTPPYRPPLVKRDSHGLIVDMNYIFDKDGYVDYRKMLKSEHLAPNKEKAGEETDVTKLEDSQLIILLSGIRYLAWLRGFFSVNYKVTAANPTYYSTICDISWIPNYETENRNIIYSAIADASKDNTGDGITSLYLAPIAENRAFVRCVRSFLRINIVSQEEIKSSNNEIQSTTDSTTSDPVAYLKSLMSSTNISFEKIKNKSVSENKDGAKDWTSVEDIPKPIIFEFIQRINQLIAANNKGAS